MVTEAIKAVNIDHDLSDRVKTSYSQQMTRAKAFVSNSRVFQWKTLLWTRTTPIERWP